MAGTTYVPIKMGRSNLSKGDAYILLSVLHYITVLCTPENADGVAARSLGGEGGEHTLSEAVADQSPSLEKRELS